MKSVLKSVEYVADSSNFAEQQGADPWWFRLLGQDMGSNA